MSEAQKPQFPAIFRIETPSGGTNACVRHARQIEGLFSRVWGMRLPAMAAPEGSQCDNCVNEAKAAARITPSQVEGMDSQLGSLS